MAYKTKTQLANRANYGGQRSTSIIKYAIAHFTANDGDSDEANARYFQNNIVKASAHIFIDDNSITQSVPDTYVAYAVGGARYSDYKQTGGASMYGIINNTNSISFEMCDTVKNGKYDVSAKTRANAISIIAQKMVLYNIPIENLYRHFDVNGKYCPRYYMGKNNKEWEKFKADVKAEMKRLKAPKTTTTVKESTSTSSKTTKTTSSAKTYTVVSGDTLSKIGTKTGVKWQDIASINGIKEPYTIKAGQVLKLTKGTTTTTKTTSTTTAKRTVAVAKATLKVGNKNAQVVILQKNLTALGYKGADGKKLVNDGKFGNNTLIALKAFQKAHKDAKGNKLTVDGVYGANSEYAMNKALNG